MSFILTFSLAPRSSRAPVFKELRYTVTPLPKLARCLHHAIRGSNFTTLYVASDAPQWELDRLEKLLAGKGVQTVSLPPYEEWGRHRWARGLAQNSQVGGTVLPFFSLDRSAAKFNECLHLPRLLEVCTALTFVRSICHPTFDCSALPKSVRQVPNVARTSDLCISRFESYAYPAASSD